MSFHFSSSSIHHQHQQHSNNNNNFNADNILIKVRSETYRQQQQSSKINNTNILATTTSSKQQQQQKDTKKKQQQPQLTSPKEITSTFFSNSNGTELIACEPQVLILHPPGDDARMRRSNYILRPYAETEISNVPSVSETGTNPERLYELQTAGMNHTEGGWPRDCDPSDPEQRLRHLRRTRKEANFLATVKELVNRSIPVLRSNNALDIYHSMFADILGGGVLGEGIHSTVVSVTNQQKQQQHSTGGENESNSNKNNNNRNKDGGGDDDHDLAMMQDDGGGGAAVSINAHNINDLENDLYGNDDENENNNDNDNSASNQNGFGDDFLLLEDVIVNDSSSAIAARKQLQQQQNANSNYNNNKMSLAKRRQREREIAIRKAQLHAEELQVACLASRHVAINATGVFRDAPRAFPTDLLGSDVKDLVRREQKKIHEQKMIAQTQEIVALATASLARKQQQQGDDDDNNNNDDDNHNQKSEGNNNNNNNSAFDNNNNNGNQLLPSTSTSNPITTATTRKVVLGPSASYSAPKVVSSLSWVSNLEIPGSSSSSFSNDFAGGGADFLLGSSASKIGGGGGGGGGGNGSSGTGSGPTSFSPAPSSSSSAIGGGSGGTSQTLAIALASVQNTPHLALLGSSAKSELMRNLSLFHQNQQTQKQATTSSSTTAKKTTSFGSDFDTGKNNNNNNSKSRFYYNSSTSRNDEYGSSDDANNVTMSGVDIFPTSLIYDAAAPQAPLLRLKTASDLIQLEFSPRDAPLLAAGSSDGTISLFDLRRGATRCVVVSDICNSAATVLSAASSSSFSPFLKGGGGGHSHSSSNDHNDKNYGSASFRRNPLNPVCALRWIPSSTGARCTEFVTADLSPFVRIWDTRFVSRGCLDTINLSSGTVQAAVQELEANYNNNNNNNTSTKYSSSSSSSSSFFNPLKAVSVDIQTVSGRVYIGTTDGKVFAFNRKGRTDSDRLCGVFQVVPKEQCNFFTSTAMSLFQQQQQHSRNSHNNNNNNTGFGSSFFSLDVYVHVAAHPTLPKCFAAATEWNVVVFADDLPRPVAQLPPSPHGVPTSIRWVPQCAALLCVSRMNGAVELWDVCVMLTSPVLMNSSSNSKGDRNNTNVGGGGDSHNNNINNKNEDKNNNINNNNNNNNNNNIATTTTTTTTNDGSRPKAFTQIMAYSGPAARTNNNAPSTNSSSSFSKHHQQQHQPRLVSTIDGNNNNISNNIVSTPTNFLKNNAGPPISSIRFGPDGVSLVAGLLDGSATLLDVTVQDDLALVAAAEYATNRNATQKGVAPITGARALELTCFSRMVEKRGAMRTKRLLQLQQQSTPDVTTSSSLHYFSPSSGQNISSSTSTSFASMMPSSSSSSNQQQQSDNISAANQLTLDMSKLSILYQSTVQTLTNSATTATVALQNDHSHPQRASAPPPFKSVDATTNSVMDRIGNLLYNPAFNSDNNQNVTLDKNSQQQQQQQSEFDTDPFARTNTSSPFFKNKSSTTSVEIFYSKYAPLSAPLAEDDSAVQQLARAIETGVAVPPSRTRGARRWSTVRRHLVPRVGGGENDGNYSPGTAASMTFSRTSSLSSPSSPKQQNLTRQNTLQSTKNNNDFAAADFAPTIKSHHPPSGVFVPASEQRKQAGVRSNSIDGLNASDNEDVDVDENLNQKNKNNNSAENFVVVPTTRRRSSAVKLEIPRQQDNDDDFEEEE